MPVHVAEVEAVSVEVKEIQPEKKIETVIPVPVAETKAVSAELEEIKSDKNVEPVLPVPVAETKAVSVELEEIQSVKKVEPAEEKVSETSPVLNESSVKPGIASVESNDSVHVARVVIEKQAEKDPIVLADHGSNGRKTTDKPAGQKQKASFAIQENSVRCAACGRNISVSCASG